MSHKDRTGRNWSRERYAYRFDLPDTVVPEGTPRPERICRYCIHYHPDRLEGNCDCGRIHPEKAVRLYDVGPLQPGCQTWTDQQPQTNDTMEEKTTPITKVCPKCGRELPSEAFNKKARSKDGLQDYCRECNSAANKAYHAKKMAQNGKKVTPKAKPAEAPEPTAKTVPNPAMAAIPDHDLVGELRRRGYEVKASKYVEL